MTREEINKLTKDILDNLADQGKVSDILSTIVTDYDDTLKNVETLTNATATLTKYNESLKSTNSKLMTQLGDFSKIVEAGKPEEKEEEPEKLNYEDLFNERGELK